MTLVTCPTCDARVSANALACPNCGEPQPAKAARRVRRREKALFLPNWPRIALAAVSVTAVLVWLNWSTISESLSNVGIVSLMIDADEYGDGWPYAVFGGGELACRWVDHLGHRVGAVTLKMGQRTYGLNGTAIDVLGLRDSRDAMLRDESGVYILGAVNEIIARGLALCKE